MKFLLRYNGKKLQLTAPSADLAIDFAKEILHERKVTFAYLFKNLSATSFICSLELVNNKYVVR
jgi:hypothetical protein